MLDPRLPDATASCDNYSVSVGAINDLNDRDKNPPDLPGEQGKAVELNEVDKELSKNTYKENQFNLLICERISLNRSLPDHRPEK